jgi:hypothetical protein
MGRKSVFIFEFIPRIDRAEEGLFFRDYFRRMIGEPYVSKCKFQRIVSSGDLKRFFKKDRRNKILKRYQFIHISGHGGARTDDWDLDLRCGECGRSFPGSQFINEKQFKEEDSEFLCPRCAGIRPSVLKREAVRLKARKERILSLALPMGRAQWFDFPYDCFAGKTVTLSACLMGDSETIEEFNLQRWHAKHIIAPRYSVRFDDSLLWYLNFYYLVLRHNYDPSEAFTRCNKFLAQKVRGDSITERGRKTERLGGFRFFDCDEIGEIARVLPN